MTATHAQRMSALQRANEIRSARARIKNEIKALPSAESFAAVARQLRNPDPVLHTAQLDTLLTAIHRVSHSRAHQLMREAGLTPSKALRRIGPNGTPAHELTADERHRLADHLDKIARRS